MYIPEYSHVIWDWNGTLLDDLEISMGITNRMLAARGLPQLDTESYREVFRFPILDYYREIGFDVSCFNDLAVEFVREFHAQAHRFRLFPGVETALSRIEGYGLSQSILSASRESDLLVSVQQLGISSRFCSIDGLNDIHAISKIERGRRSLAALKAVPDRTLLIGDTTHDFEVAQAIGCDCLLIASGHQSRRRLDATGAAVIDSIQELI